MCVLSNVDGMLRGKEVRIWGFQSGVPQQYILMGYETASRSLTDLRR